LFAGTERPVYESFDDGDHWRSLRNDMPATSVRDLAIKDDDLIAATHGRGFWILDDITALRQEPTGQPFLFEPAVAYRVRWNTNTDTPLPPDTPAGENPPDGAPIDFLLASSAAQVTLEILDGKGALVRRWSADDPIAPPDPKLAIPHYWLRPSDVLHRDAGMHRIVWDLHEQPLPAPRDYPIAAVPHRTAPSATSPWVVPGTYKVVLAVDGAKQTRTLVVKMDPRVKTSPRDLSRQSQLARVVVDDLKIAGALDGVKTQLAKAPSSAAVADLTKQIDAATGASPKLATRLVRALRQVQGADIAPSAQAEQLVNDLHAIVAKLSAAMKAAGVTANGAAMTIEPPEDEE
jgi:hypothetical protein